MSDATEQPGSPEDGASRRGRQGYERPPESPYFPLLLPPDEASARPVTRSSAEPTISRPLAQGAFGEQPVRPVPGSTGGNHRRSLAEAAASVSEPDLRPPAPPPIKPDSWSADVRTPRNPPSLNADGTKQIRIGLWGGPGSGKTTFIGALRTAAEQRQRTGEHWTIVGGDDESLDFLKSSYNALLIEKKFPGLSKAAQIYHFKMKGDIPAPASIWRRRGSRSTHVEFHLSVRDRPGGYFEDDHLRDDPEMITELADCDGLLYLYDPVNMGASKDSLTYFQATLARLAAEVDKRGEFVGAKLPHRLAVCITKFDNPELFNRAREWQMSQDDPVTGQAYVPGTHASAFFDRLCEESAGTAEYVRDAIRSYFLADRVRYYVVAAIGYNRSVRQVNYEDPINAGELESGDFVIRSKVNPVNVVEPIIDLERMIRLGRTR